MRGEKGGLEGHRTHKAREREHWGWKDMGWGRREHEKGGKTKTSARVKPIAVSVLISTQIM
jgi:hypothetical protein